MNTTRLFQWLGLHQRAIHIVMAPTLIVLVAAVYVLVYMTGGIKFVYSHSMYIPILMAGLVFGIKGGIFIGLLGGLALGPFMPIDVASGELQKTINWLYRTGFFTLVGFLNGAASDSVRAYLRHLKWVSRHDAFTQLPNRDALLDALSGTMGKKNAPESFLLVVISLENVMELKSAFGFDVIEEIIQQSAHRLENSSQYQSLVYRTGTEQIGILIDNKGAQKIEVLVTKLVECARQPFLFNDIPIHADSRIGYVTFGKAVEAPEVYLQRAESALIVAHEKAQESVGYNPNITVVAKENLSILGELMGAIEKGQLSLHYQPKIALSTGHIHSAEALMRWHHPQRGDIPPGIFIPRAEQSTLIHLITEFALEQTMQQIVRWRREGIHIPIAVNISPRNLSQPGFSDLILRLLDRYDLSGESLELEVTEGALMTDMDHTIAELTRLADADIAISIDDFGTGYSSLQYLHQLPISFIKIDQSFARRLPADEGAVHIVEAAVTLAHKMRIKTIAEGVENKEVYDLLGYLGCDMAQGFNISRPLPAEDFAKWYTQRETSFSY